jgi:molybdate/tungstate transport system substrate-binding protein
VTVLYAGSLVGVMEQAIGPAFTEQTGIGFQGHAGGSKGLAAQIKAGSLHGNVFVSAHPRVNADLTGGANGDRINWYIVPQRWRTPSLCKGARFAAKLAV